MKKTLYIFFTLTTFVFLNSCKNESEIHQLKMGDWRGEITIQNQQLPFNFQIKKVGESYVIDFYDGDSVIELNEVKVIKDSLFFTMHIFDIDVKVKIEENTLHGTYTKNYATDYVLPFKATFGKSTKLDNANSDPFFNGKWSIKIHNKNGTDRNVIGVFKTEEGILKGTLLSRTGDYRFLEGTSENGEFTLYGFDGNHMYIFKAKATDDVLKGDFWSGKTLHLKFTGVRDENAELPKESEMDFLKEGHDKIDFTFPNLDGKLVSLSDEKYRGKVVILQLLGTWCPNCMDETKFYQQWFEENKDRGIEIIGLAYEVKDDYEYARNRVQKMKDKLNIDYDFVIAGTSSSKSTSKSLPMLNRKITFPMSVIIDKKGVVRDVHIGFSGPATGDYYHQFIEEFNTMMDGLLAE